MIRNSIYCILLCLLCSIQARFVIRDDPITNDTRLQHFTPRSLDELYTDATSSIKTLTMHGSVALGYYFTTLYFGTPAQRQTLIVDTGSTITTIPCNECGSSCGVSHLSEFFDPEESQSFKEMTCRETFGNYICNDCRDSCSFSIRYSEGSSYQGRYKKDYISFDGPEKKPDSESSRVLLRKNSEENERRLEAEEAIPAESDTRMFMPFGCTLKETNLFLTQEADGIFGLGVDTNSPYTPPNVFDYLHMSNSSVSNAFSICMGAEGGYLAVGGYNTTYHAADELVQYVPFDGSTGQYRIYWKSVQFEGETLNIEERVLNEDRGAYVDSGTTLMYTTNYIARVINDALVGYCRKEGKCGGNIKEDVCWKRDSSIYSTVEEFFSTFGTFTFQFGKDGESEYEWKPEDYLFRYAPHVDYYCLGLERLSGKKTLFGGAFMKNHDVLFDKDNHRLGFIRSNCSAEYSLADYPRPMHPSAFDEHEGTMNLIRVLLITFIAVSLLFLLGNLLIKYIQSVRAKRKFANIELGISVSNHEDDVLDPTDSDFEMLQGENPRFQRRSEDYAV